MLPRMVPHNTSNGQHADDSLCGSSTSDNNCNLRRHSITCLPSSSASPTWFHGSMNKNEADNVLLDSTKGSFLVRKQDPSRFFISVATLNGVEHHPVKRIGRQYFYNGKSYSSLSDLVSLIKEQGGEPLSVSPFQTNSSDSSEEKNLTRCFARVSFNGTLNNNAMSTSAGDILTIIEKPSSEWVAAVNNRTCENGFVPSSILTSLFNDTDDICKAPYVHGLDVANALRELKNLRGSFLIRPSSQGPGYWAIMVNVGNEQVKKFLIREARDKEGGWILAGRRFKSVPHIIDRYCHFPILDDVKLCHAVLVEPIYDVYTHRTWASTTTENDSEARKQYSEDKKLLTIQAFRKTREDKPWKPCFLCIQDDTDGFCELLVADDYQFQKIKLVFRLPFCVLYNCDDSVFERDGCFYISQCDLERSGIFINVQPYYKFAEWMCLLRTRILALQPGSTPHFDGFHFDIPQSPPLCVMRVYLDKYRCEALKSDHLYSAQLMLNGVRICNSALLAPTSGRSGFPTVVFDSSFIIPFAPFINASVQISVTSQQKGKTLRPFGMTPVMMMPNSKLTTVTFDNGLTLRVSQTKLTVYDEGDYISAQEWLESCPFEFLEYVSDNLVSQDRTLLSLAIVNQLYSQPGKLLSFIDSLLKHVLQNSVSENVLRQDSLATSVISQVLRVSARLELEKGIDERLISSTKLADAHDIEALVYSIISLCQIEMVAQVLSLVKRVAVNRFPDEPHVVRRVLSNVLILRFTNPIILTKFSGLPIGQVIAKGIQSVANSACSRSTDADEFTHVKALRKVFEELSTEFTTSFQVAQSRPSNFEWLAIACHLMYTTLASTSEAVPYVPDSILRVLHAHKPQN